MARSKNPAAKEEELKKQTRELSIKEGSAAAVMSGAGESYIVPYALALNASNAQIGFLASFVNLIGSVSQIFGERLVERFQRRTVIILPVLMQATMWLVILALGILAWKDIINSYAAGILIVLYCIYAIAGNLMGPAWFSLMGDIVKENERGRYFSNRSKIVGLTALIATILAAIFLDYMKNIGLVIIGFAALFFIASIGRYASAFFFAKHYYPKYETKKEAYFSFFQFIRKAPQNNFGKFVIYSGLMNLAVNFAAPFFTVYMLKELNYSYFWLIIVLFSHSVFVILSMPLWGKLGDRYGNRQLLKIGSCMIPFASLLWLVSKNPIVLTFTAQLVSGIGWAAFNLASSNFIYDAATPQKRGLCVAYFNVIGGIGVFFGAMLGGLFAQYVHVRFMSVFLLMFLISGLGRAAMALIFMPMIKEVKVKPSMKNVHIISYITTGMARPFYGAFRGALSIMANMNRRAEYRGVKNILNIVRKRKKDSF